MAEAASITLVSSTTWQALVEVGKAKLGQQVFIQAGAGGVGTFAFQLAKHLGATVATTTSAKIAELVRSLGADVFIDYQIQAFEYLLSDYDLVLNPLPLSNSMRDRSTGGVACPLEQNALLLWPNSFTWLNQKPFIRIVRIGHFQLKIAASPASQVSCNCAGDNILPDAILAASRMASLIPPNNRVGADSTALTVFVVSVGLTDSIQTLRN